MKERREKKTRRSPGKWRPELAEQVKRMCAKGLTDAEIAEIIGVHRQTLGRWRADKPELEAAWRAGCDEFNAERVEGALLSRALGFSCQEVTEEFRVSLENTPDGPLTTKEPISAKQVTRFVPPSVAACQMILYNRRPHRWRPKQEGAQVLVPVLNVHKHYGKIENGEKKETIEAEAAGQPARLIDLQIRGERPPRGAG